MKRTKGSFHGASAFSPTGSLPFCAFLFSFSPPRSVFQDRHFERDPSLFSSTFVHTLFSQVRSSFTGSMFRYSTLIRSTAQRSPHNRWQRLTTNFSWVFASREVSPCAATKDEIGLGSTEVESSIQKICNWQINTAYITEQNVTPL